MSDTVRKQFDAIFVAHRDSLLHTLIRIVGNPAIAEELAQESYLRVRNSLGQDRFIEHLKPFLFQTARNLALDHLRSAKRQSWIAAAEDGEDPLENIPCALPGTEEIVANRESVQRLAAVLGQLSERQQRVFVLNRLHGWSHARIAVHLGVSESTVQKDVKMAMSVCISLVREQVF